MNLDYVFGPVVATDTILNVNVQFHRVFDRQEKTHGWAWTADDDEFGIMGDCTGGSYDIDEETVIDDLIAQLRDELHDKLDAWYETHPRAVRSR